MDCLLRAFTINPKKTFGLLSPTHMGRKVGSQLIPGIPSKRDMLTQCWFNVGPPSTTLAKHNFAQSSHRFPYSFLICPRLDKGTNKSTCPPQIRRDDIFWQTQRALFCKLLWEGDSYANIKAERCSDVWWPRLRWKQVEPAYHTLATGITMYHNIMFFWQFYHRTV